MGTGHDDGYTNYKQTLNAGTTEIKTNLKEAMKKLSCRTTNESNSVMRAS